MSVVNRPKISEENQILFVKNLPFNATSDDLYNLFGQFGSIRQIRVGNASNTKGTAFVVYDHISDAKSAYNKLAGFNYQNRYLVVLFHSVNRMKKVQYDLETRRANLEQLKEKEGIE
ncbi:uncharacterized protein SAPINGB_P002072 [Magnusiomyces paraingens]|uniref:RRM domain-containing protein n=1 Tax=Magnusiomyces paraingens TaxID=2606893 RepID=A0A5E8BE96_9ASCO|nr:uncharacterized protein SAPINGB_P002072 [Saprochaete ingens]VVT49035.1 unnamed protein product [Saprochaete ingens]